VFRGRTSLSRLFGLFLAILFLSVWPITENIAFLKNDSLGILLAVSGMLLAARARSFWILVLAAFLAVAAMATKQSYVAAAVAAAVFLWANDRRACATYCAAVGFFAMLAAVGATAYFGSGFWFCVVSAHQLPYEFGAGAWILKAGFAQPLASALVFAAVAVLYAQGRKSGATNVVQTSPSSTYFATATLVTLATFWKPGASTNYLSEIFFAACLVVAESAGSLTWRRPWSEKAIVLSVGLSLMGLLDIVSAHPKTYAFLKEPAEIEAHLVNYRECVLTCGTIHPRILNMSWHDDMFTFDLEPSLNDPWLYRRLWANHRLSPEPVAAAIARQEYDLVIAPGDPIPGAEEIIRPALLDKYHLVATDSATKNTFFIRK
jgi:hypothetical protein